MKNLIQLIIQYFSSVPDLDKLVFPDITIGRHTYSHEDRKKLLKALVDYQGEDYCGECRNTK